MWSERSFSSRFAFGVKRRVVEILFSFVVVSMPSLYLTCIPIVKRRLTSDGHERIIGV